MSNNKRRIGIGIEGSLPEDFTDFLANIFEFSINLSAMGSITFSILGFTYQLWWNFMSQQEQEQMVDEVIDSLKINRKNKF